MKSPQCSSGYSPKNTQKLARNAQNGQEMLKMVRTNVCEQIGIL